LVYTGGGNFVMTEERNRTAVQFSYLAGSTLTRAQTSTVKLATTVGNTGLEGITSDPVTGGFIFVNQRTSSSAAQNIFQTGINFAAGTATNGSASTVNNTSLFPVGNIGYSNLHDVFALANVYDNTVSGNQNLLVLTLTGIKEMTRTGAVVGSRALLGDPPYAVEGMTMDAVGRLYLVSDNGDPGSGQNSTLFVYAPVPEPESYAFLLAGLALLGAVARRRRLSSGRCV